MHLRISRALIFVFIVAVALTATLPALAEASIRGRAKDMEGKPLIDVSVQLIPAKPDFMTLSAKSNKKGKFVIGLIRPTDYRLIAIAQGMRIVRLDINVAEPDDDDFWSFHEDIQQGSETPAFRLTGLSKVTYDIVFEPHDGDPGSYGTGLPISPVKVITGLIEDGDMDGAIRVVELNLKSDPDSATYNYLHAFVLQAQSLSAEALPAIDKTIASDPGFEGANLLKGRILESQGQSESAMEAFGKELEIAQSDAVRADALLEMTIIHENAEDFESAVATLERLVEIVPDHAGAYKELADLQLRLGHQEQAQAMMEKVMELGASDPNLLFNLGAARFNASDFETAADYFQKTIELAPEFRDAYLRLAYTNLNLGRMDEAKSNLEKYLELSSDDDPEAQTARAILTQISKP